MLFVWQLAWVLYVNRLMSGVPAIREEEDE